MPSLFYSKHTLATQANVQHGSPQPAKIGSWVGEGSAHARLVCALQTMALSIQSSLEVGGGETATASPALQEAAALLVAQMPVAEAAAILEWLTGVKCSPSTWNGRLVGKDGDARTGMDVIDWLEVQVEVYGFVPPVLLANHSANSVAKQRMGQLTDSGLIGVSGWQLWQRD